ncbi:hypothetical protein [Polaribacter sp. IC073]|uniref:hypothetical protein n=1 Tax=Polaribacter sp. IC073 TaxID=2508540 RepID=UPI0011BF5128|nr:hypothetical protein [Polaribacter sp. IC073]TXD49993.1 hypothetical protein ES045_02090 [Polaribacter sp. IC073]
MTPLILYSYQIILLLILLFSLVVTALFLASKNKSNTRFLIWGAIILCVPFIGALACIINYYIGKKEVKTV